MEAIQSPAASNNRSAIQRSIENLIYGPKNNARWCCRPTTHHHTTNFAHILCCQTFSLKPSSATHKTDFERIIDFKSTTRKRLNTDDARVFRRHSQREPITELNVTRSSLLRAHAHRLTQIKTGGIFLA